MLCISLQAFRRPPCCTLTLLMTSSFQEKINNRGSSGEEKVWLPGEMKDFIKKTKAKASYLSPTRCKGAAGKKVTWGNEVKQKTLTGWRAGPGAMSANQAQDWIKKKTLIKCGKTKTERERRVFRNSHMLNRNAECLAGEPEIVKQRKHFNGHTSNKHLKR